MSKIFEIQDKYFRKAKEKGFRARSAFKLEGIQERFHILKPGDKVLDLGAAPGSFLQYAASVIGEKGQAVGIDLQEIKSLKLPNVTTITGDIFDDKLFEALPEFDVITSDLAPKTSGVKFVDAGRSLELNLRVLEIVEEHLKKGGYCVMKILPGFNEGELIGPAKKLFRQVKKFRPQAVRKSSGEGYIVCLNKR